MVNYIFGGNRVEPIELELEETSSLEKLSYNILPPLKDDPNLSRNIALGSIWIGVVSAIIFLVSRSFTDIFFFWLLAIVYSALCLKSISPERKGIRVHLGTPEVPESDEVYSGGIYWRWLFLQKFYLYPTEATIINIPPQDVVSPTPTLSPSCHVEKQAIGGFDPQGDYQFQIVPMVPRPLDKNAKGEDKY